MCMIVTIAVATLGYVVLSYVGISAGPAVGGVWLPPDQFHGHPAWHRSRHDDPVSGGI